MKSIAGTKDVRHRGRLLQGHAARLQGQADPLVPGRRSRATRTSCAQNYKEFFEAFRKTYPNIELEEQGITYNDLLDKFRTALLGNAAPMVVRLQILGGTEFAAKGYLAAAEARGRRLFERRLLARRDEVGHLGRRDLRHSDQQRDDGASSGTPTSSSAPASIPTRRRRPGTTSSPTPSRSTTSSASPATASSPARTPATRPTASCRSSGPTAAASSTRPRPTRPTRTVELDSPQSKAALQASYDMYVRDKSVPVSALTNTADRQPGAVPRRPARDDDLAPVRLRRDAGPAEEGDGRRQGEGADASSPTCATG